MDQATHNKIVSFIWGIADDVLPEKTAKQIFGAADRIMKAGQSVQRALD